MNDFKDASQQEIYGELAKVYNQLMNKDKYIGWNHLIKDSVSKYSIPNGKCLDIACGTGVISGLLLEQGFEVIGIDLSEDMLKVARSNYPKANFLAADIRDFKLKQQDINKIVLAVSFYDSLNYLLSDDDMLKMFRSVSNNIPDEAIFIFDISTRSHISISQQSAPKIYENEKIYTTFRSSGKNRLWVLDIDLFIEQKKGLFKHYKEQHIEKGYDEEDIVTILKETNFDILEVKKESKVYEDGKEHLSRLYFVVQNKKKQEF